jgi:hypothetical protein
MCPRARTLPSSLFLIGMILAGLERLSAEAFQDRSLQESFHAT